ncbi:MAG TPA: o-succinylbenzoate synthase [Bacteroidetes bacterium]|nr:o-succinylbenzoate synthase [Bacteroidota bacterium]
MRLLAAQIYAYAVPFRPLRADDGKTPVRSGLFLRLSARAPEGEILSGFGEVAPWPPPDAAGLAELTDQAEEGLRAVGRLPATQLMDVSKDALLPPGLSPAVHWGLDSARADLLARVQGLPLHRLLSPASRSRVPVNAVLQERPEGLEEAVTGYLAKGIQTFKIKVGSRSPGEERQILETVWRLSGRTARFRLDANRMWRFSEAARRLEAFRDFLVEYVEEPLCPEDLPHLPELYRKTGVPAALDESLAEFSPEAPVLRGRAVAALVLKPQQIGGFGAIRRWCRLARTLGKSAVFSSSLETGFGLALLAHVAAAWGTAGVPAGLHTLDFLQESLVTEETEIREGALILPAAPGAGVSPLLDAQEVELVREVALA